MVILLEKSVLFVNLTRNESFGQAWPENAHVLRM